MSKLDLNFTMDYCRRWPLSAAVREVLQNARDVEILGGRMEVEHSAKTSTLVVTSHGQYMTSRALVFGATDKAGDARTIGQFGDGLKVALGVFLRHACAVKINTGRELWVPCVVERDGERLVGVTTRALPVGQHRDRVEFSVGGVTAADWAQWRRMFLFLQPAQDVTSTPRGSLIRDSDRRGDVYCKGILVCRIDDLKYAYDVPDLELNRDRQVADTWEVRRAAREIWAEAARPSPRADAAAQEAVLREMYALLSSHDQDDLEVGQYSAPVLGPVADHLADLYRAEHGDAVPVASSAEAAQAAQIGRQAVVVPASLRAVLRTAGVADLAQVRAQIREDATRRYLDDDLTPREVDALQGALSALGQAVAARGEVMPVVEVVDFADPARGGLYDPAADRVLLARRVLADHRVYGVLAHEIAHRHGGDGDAAHREAIEDLMGRAIGALLRG